MTGGSLPAMIWHVPMAYAHQGIEIKYLAGLPQPGRQTAAAHTPGVAATTGAKDQNTLAAATAADRVDPARHRRAGADRAS